MRDWQLAQQRARIWEAEGIAAGGAPTTVKDAYAKFLEDAEARGLREATLRKYRLLFRQLNDFCDQSGSFFLNQLNVDSTRAFRGTWKLGPLASQKHLERLRSFFRFCVDSGWMDTNPAKSLKAPKITETPVVPFSESDIEKILAACDLYNGNGLRIKALSELMLLSGLRIGDACTITRDKFVQDDKGWKLELHTAKTGVKVYIPLPDDIVQTIQKLPGAHPFWSGESTSDHCSSVWQKAYRRVFKLAGIKGHPHQFRHSFATRLLREHVPIETVSRLLGHASVRITERHYASWTPERQELSEAALRKTWARLGHTEKRAR